jgi:hypothetical protein
VGWTILRDHESALNGVLEGLCTQRTSLYEFLEDEVKSPKFYYGADTEIKYQEVYVKMYRKLIPDGYTSEDDILEGYCGWDIDWPSMTMTLGDFVGLAECEISHWREVRNELIKMS